LYKNSERVEQEQEREYEAESFTDHRDNSSTNTGEEIYEEEVRNRVSTRRILIDEGR
jgi:hypothetical protein